LKGYQAFVYSLSLSRTGNLVATGAVDGTIKVWALDSDELRADWYHAPRTRRLRGDLLVRANFCRAVLTVAANLKN
jgi:WD40 repeat protein